MRITGAGYVGDFPVEGNVLVPFRVDSDYGCPLDWAPGVVAVVGPDGVGNEAGVTVTMNQPAVLGSGQTAAAAGNHVLAIDLAETPAFFVPCKDYRVLIFGDPIGGVPVQGVCVGQFSVRNR